MADSIFASKAVCGGQYVTKAGHPVQVVAINKKVMVRGLLTGEEHLIWKDELLWPYSQERITKEAMDMAKLNKTGNVKKSGEGKRGEARGAQRVPEGIVLFRNLKGVRHEVLCAEGILKYRAKNYATLKEVATAIRGETVSGSGRSFFGLRSEPNIGLGKEVLKQLADAAAAQKDALVKAKPPRKTRKVKEEEDEDEGKGKGAPAAGGSVAQLVGKVFGKGR